MLVESAVSISERHAWFGRLELNGKPAHDLHIHEFPGVFAVGKVQAGYTRYLDAQYGLQPGVGIGLLLTLRPAQHQMMP